MKLLNECTIIVKKSKFISYFYEIREINEVDLILNELKKEHKKASHFPYAYQLNNYVKKTDDKEPSGSAGMPILNILEKNNLKANLIVVVRYFGGTKLGVGGLFRAYSASAREVIKY